MRAHAHFVEEIRTASRCEMVDITDRVRAAVSQLNVRDGLVVVQSPHTTGAITVNENADPDVQRDLTAKLQRLIPKEESFYRHSEGNSDAHLKTSLVGMSLTLLVEEGELLLGQWQGVYFCEFDGPRQRQVWIKVFAAESFPARRVEKA